MKDPLFQKFYSSFTAHVEEKSRVLLALSGGLDSSALLHLLLEAQKLYPFTLVCVYVDHGWREESKREGEILKKNLESLGVPFFVKTISEPFVKKNVENRFRELRYARLHEVYVQEQCNTLLTAHQADDQAETVLKRVFEGASLHNFAGIQEVNHLFGMRVVRPLLLCYRDELKRYLERKKSSFFHDTTNDDCTYTRARIRHEILPYLEKTFGKNIKENLLHVAAESRVYTTPVFDRIQRRKELFQREIPWRMLETLSAEELHALIQIRCPHFSKRDKKLVRHLILEKKKGKKLREVSLGKEGVKIEDKF